MLDASAQEIIWKKSTIPHPDFGLGLLAAQNIVKREDVTYYCGSLIYAERTEKSHDSKPYGESVIQVTSDTFQK